MKQRFKVTNPGLITKFINSPRTVDHDGNLQFTWIEVLMIARATGLRSKKSRHIKKRFQLVMKEAIDKLLESVET